MKLVTGIDLTFENCEGSGILTVGDMHDSDVNTMEISGITREIRTFAVNAVAEFINASSVTLLLNPSSNGVKATLFDRREDLFDRIMKCPDIVDINVYYDDNSKETIYVPWGGDSEFMNAWQETKLTEDGKLEIIIKEVA